MSTPMSRMVSISSSSTLSGRRNDGNIGAHQAAGLVVLLEDRDFVAERHQIVGDGERRGTRADAGDALAVLRSRGSAAGRSRDVAAMIGRHALQAADGDRLAVQAAAAAGRLARAVAGAAENRRETRSTPG